MFLVAVAFVYAVVAVYSLSYLRPGIGHIRLRRVYWPLLNPFGFALLATPMVANLGCCGSRSNSPPSSARSW